MVCSCTSILIALVVIFILKKLFETFAAKSRTAKLFSRLAVFQSNRLQNIKNTENLKSLLPADFKQNIIKSDALSLVRLLNEGKVTSFELVLVFYERAITVGLGLGALAEVNILHSALEQAIKCDEIRTNLIKMDPGKLESLPHCMGFLCRSNLIL